MTNTNINLTVNILYPAHISPSKSKYAPKTKNFLSYFNTKPLNDYLRIENCMELKKIRAVFSHKEAMFIWNDGATSRFWFPELRNKYNFSFRVNFSLIHKFQSCNRNCDMEKRKNHRHCESIKFHNKKSYLALEESHVAGCRL